MTHIVVSFFKAEPRKRPGTARFLLTLHPAARAARLAEGTSSLQALLVGLVVVTCLLPLGGCDYLPEAITGIPDPNAQAIQAAGPSGLNASTNSSTVANVAAPVEWNGPTAVGNTAVTPAGAQESFGSAASGVVQSGGSSINEQFLSSLPSNSSTATVAQSGIEVPAANTAPMSDGKIIVTANLRFVNDQEVAAPADGLITLLDIDEGDLVAKGNLVGQLDDRLPKSELDVATKEYEAAVEKAKDKSEIEYSKASSEVAGEDLKITEELEKRGASNQLELQKKWLEAKRAELAITVAEVKNRQDVAASQVANAKRGAAEVQIELRRIVSPFDGIVADKKKEKHDWVRAGEIIMRLVSMEQLRVTGQVFSAQLKRAPHELVGAPVVIDIEVFPGKVERVNGKIGYISPVMDTSGGYKIWAQIPNMQSNGQWVFREGMPAKIEFNAN